MRESCVYPDHGVCIISVDNIINNIAEPAIIRFCIDHNITITPKSRDVAKIIKHFVADTLITQLEHYRDHRVVLNYIPIKHSLLGDALIDKINHTTTQIFKRFNLCNTNIDHPIDEFNTQHLYEIRVVIENCSIKERNTKSIKKYLQQHQLTALTRRVSSVACNYILNK